MADQTAPCFHFGHIRSEEEDDAVADMVAGVQALTVGAAGA